MSIPQVAATSPVARGRGRAVSFGREHYRRRSGRTSTLLQQLWENYQGEGLAMPYTMDDFLHDYVKSHFKRLSPQERREALQGLPPEELLEILSPEQLDALLQRGRQDPHSATKKRPTTSRRRRKGHTG